MELSRNFIQLQRQFDAQRLAAEIEALPQAAWRAHPSRMGGNTALALVSRNGEDNDAFDGPMTATPHLEACAYLVQVLASFEQVIGRSRLMCLAPGAEVKLHVDFNYHWVSRVRIHVPITTEPEVIFHCADERVHMAPGSSWLFNSWRRHKVIHGGTRPRVHLVIDTAGSSRFWREVRQAAASPGFDEPAPLAFKPGAKPRIETERYNTSPVMAPAELDALVAELEAEFTGHPGNDPGLVQHYRDLLSDLRHDWRANWHRFGPSPDGWPAYRELITRARNGLHPNPRALLTASNEIGVNPVIVQRILAPALDESRLPDLLRALGRHAQS